MSVEFNFNNLKNIYMEAIESYDKSLIFEIKIGRGQYLFTMFLSAEDADAKDNLFIYMRNTNSFIQLKTYGYTVPIKLHKEFKNEVTPDIIKPKDGVKHEETQLQPRIQSQNRTRNIA